MRRKNTFILLILVLALSFTSAPGSGKDRENPDFISGTELNSGIGADLKCRLQSKRSTLRHSGGGHLTVSINSDWVCR